MKHVAQEVLIGRYVKFLQSIQKSDKLAVKMMLQKVLYNVATVTGQNMRYIEDNLGQGCRILNADITWVKKNINFCEIREEDMWKVKIIKEITNITQNSLEFSTEEDNFLSKEQLQEIIDFVSAS